MRETGVKHLIYLNSIFMAALITANFTAGVKLVDLWGFIVPAGFVSYAITFTITDIIDEVYGKREGYWTVRAGFVASVVMLALVWLARIMPPLVPAMQETYVRAFDVTARIVFASMVAYLISQHHDVWAFHWWKIKTKGKWLWLRNNLSTATSQLIDTVLFITIAFYGVVTADILLRMILSQWIWKVVIALADTPFVYLGVHLISGKVKILRT